VDDPWGQVKQVAILCCSREVSRTIYNREWGGVAMEKSGNKTVGEEHILYFFPISHAVKICRSPPPGF
jgi:hypothetical protein